MLINEVHVDKLKTSDNIKRLMSNRNHTRKDLAKMIGVSEPAIANYLTGKNQPSLQTLGALAKLYNVEISDIISYKEDIDYEEFKSENDQKTN